MYHLEVRFYRSSYCTLTVGYIALVTLYYKININQYS